MCHLTLFSDQSTPKTYSSIHFMDQRGIFTLGNKFCLTPPLLLFLKWTLHSFFLSTSHTSPWTCEDETIVSHSSGTLGGEHATDHRSLSVLHFPFAVAPGVPLKAYLTGTAPCPPWTRRQSGCGRSSSCSCGWPWCRRTVQTPPWWAAPWRSPADRPQTLSCTQGGALAWLEAAGLFKRCATESKGGFRGVGEKAAVRRKLSNNGDHYSDVPQPLENRRLRVNDYFLTEAVKTMQNDCLSNGKRAWVLMKCSFKWFWQGSGAHWISCLLFSHRLGGRNVCVPLCGVNNVNVFRTKTEKEQVPTSSWHSKLHLFSAYLKCHIWIRLTQKAGKKKKQLLNVYAVRLLSRRE